MAVNPLADEKFDIFTLEDRQFLAEFFVRHPHIGENFERFLSYTPSQRVALAEETIKTMPRAGWVKRGIEQPETVYEHVEGLAEMVGNYLSRTGAPLLRRIHLMEMARNHDLPEAIASDFTWQDNISQADKKRIELLAAKVIFEAPQYARNLALVHEYAAQETPESHLLHDFDKIHVVRGALFYEATAPEAVHIEDKTLWDEFYNYDLPRMKTEEGRAYMLDMEQNKDAHIAALKHMPAPTISHAR